MKELLKAKREEAAKLLAKATAIKDEFAGKPWTPEKEAEFDAIMADFGKANVEAQRLQARVEQIDSLEQHSRDYNDPAPGARVPQRGASPEQQAKAALRHREVFHRYVRYGREGLTTEELREFWRQPGPTEQHAHSSVVGELGGFLAPAEFRNEIVKDLPNYATIRPLARTYPCGGPVLQLPTIQPKTGSDTNIYSSGYVGSWKPENYVTGGTAPPVQNQPTFGLESVPVHIWQPDAVELPVSLLEDAKADLDQVMREIIAEVWALDEDAAFTRGDGVGKPLGLQNSGLTEVVTGSAAALTYDGIVNLFTGLPAQYRKNAQFMCNSQGYGSILKLKDSTNKPLFPIGADVEKLFNKMIAINEFMPDVGSGTYPIIFGDFRYYGIADRQELRIQRLLDRFAPNVGILAMARVGGQVLRKNAFRIQKCST